MNRKTLALICAAALAAILGGWAFWHPSPSSPRSGTRGGEQPDDATRPEQALLQPAPKGMERNGAAAAANATVRVDVSASTEDGASAGVSVYAGSAPAALVPVTTLASGQTKTIEIPSTSIHWFADISKGDPAQLNYNSVSLKVDPLVSGSRVALKIPRASGLLSVQARNESGQPVGLVLLELTRAQNPRQSQMLTGADGDARWEGVRGDLVSTDGVRVVDLPAGYQLLEDPVVAIARDPASNRVTGTVKLRLGRCTAGFDVDLPDARLARVALERKIGSSWAKVTPALEAELDPPANFEKFEFAEDTPPLSAQLRGRGLCPGECRLTLIGMTGVLGVATIELTPREITTARLSPIQVVRLAGTVVGPARGVARRLDLNVLEAAGAAESLVNEALPVVLHRDGSFELNIPEGVRQFSVTGSGAGETPYVVVPAVRSLSARMEVESQSPGNLRGRVVDKSGRGVADVAVGAAAEPVDSRGQFVASRTRVVIGTTRTKADGSWTLGPGCPGTWLLSVEPTGKPRITKRVPVRDGGNEDAGEIRVE